MKKTLLLLLMALAVLSCNREPADNEFSHLLEDADRIVEAYNAGTLPKYQKAKHVVGDLSLREDLFNDQRMVFLTVGDYTFTIQNHKDVAFHLPKGKVEVIYLERELILNDLSTGKSTLYTEDDEVSEHLSSMMIGNKQPVVGLGTSSS